MSGTRIPFLQGQADQPDALERVVAHVRAQLDRAGLEPLRGASRPLFAGIGASFAVLAVPVQILRDHGVPAQRVFASEIAAGTAGFDADLLVGVSQGGRSSETVAAFQAARDLVSVAVLNVSPSPLGELADITVDFGNEPDSYASTVGFTGAVVALDLIAGAITARDAADDPWDDIAGRVRAVRALAAGVIGGLRVRAAGCVAADVVAAGASRARPRRARGGAHVGDRVRHQELPARGDGVGRTHPAPGVRRRARDRTRPRALGRRTPHAAGDHGAGRAGGVPGRGPAAAGRSRGAGGAGDGGGPGTGGGAERGARGADRGLRVRQLRHQGGRCRPRRLRRLLPGAGARLQLPRRDPLPGRRRHRRPRAAAHHRQRHLHPRGGRRDPLEAHRHLQRVRADPAPAPAGGLLLMHRRQLRLRLPLVLLPGRHHRTGGQAHRHPVHLRLPRPGLALRHRGRPRPGRTGPPAPVQRAPEHDRRRHRELRRGDRRPRSADRPGQPARQRADPHRHPLRRESEAGRLNAPERGRVWRVVNPSVANGLGQPVGFTLYPQPNPTLLADPQSSLYGRAAFATRNLWVTKYDPAHRYPAGDLVNQHPGGAGIPEFTAGDRDLVDTDLVLWHTFGTAHFPRPEDWPVMPVDRCGFTLKPSGFFDHNPTLDLPAPSGGGHCHAAPAED